MGADTPKTKPYKAELRAVHKVHRHDLLGRDAVRRLQPCPVLQRDVVHFLVRPCSAFVDDEGMIRGTSILYVIFKRVKHIHTILAFFYSHVEGAPGEGTEKGHVVGQGRLSIDVGKACYCCRRSD